MKRKINISILVLFAITLSNKVVLSQKQSPNILWLLTDDHRYDAIRAFNKMLHGREMSELGYVESPNIDRLAGMGTTFINTYCQAQGCAPSRASMHYGRYPFRSGVYEFESHNNKAEHFKPTLPEQMAKLGYQTLHIGKLGLRLRTVENGKVTTPDIYQNNIHFQTLRKDGYTDWGKDWFTHLDGTKLEKRSRIEFFVSPQKKFKYVSLDLENEKAGYAGMAQKTNNEYDILRHYNNHQGKHIDKGVVLSGVSPQPAGKTRDGYYTSIFKEYLENKDKTFCIGSQTINPIDDSKPQFFYIGYDFPHTPVLPPASYRKRFQQYKYKVPEFDKSELLSMSKQMKQLRPFRSSDHFTDKEKQKMIQDYYAFCAYGDALIGLAVDAFIAYNKKQNKPWMIVYVNGDHGWKLNEHGSVSKFTPWEEDCHNPIIVVSSDKKKYPAGKVVRDYTEFVDIAPTILAAGGANLQKDKYRYLDGMDLAKVASGEAPVRDYVVGESHAVTGPRAYIRTKDYIFSIQTRPSDNKENKSDVQDWARYKKGENMEWARTASYKELDPALYHTKTDPKEVNNLAFAKEYRKIARAMKEKLIDIVLGDNRVEVNWGIKGDGMEVYRSNFAPGAHDYRLKLD